MTIKQHKRKENYYNKSFCKEFLKRIKKEIKEKRL